MITIIRLIGIKVLVIACLFMYFNDSLADILVDDTNLNSKEGSNAQMSVPALLRTIGVTIASTFATTPASDASTKSIADEINDDFQRQIDDNIQALIRCLDMLVYMEVKDFVEVLEENPEVPHFVLRKTEARLQARGDTSFGYYGLTDVGLTEAERVESQIAKGIKDDDLLVSLTARASVLSIEAVSEQIADEYGIPSQQSFYAALLLKQNYQTKFNKQIAYSNLTDDLLKTYEAWNRGPRSNYESRIKNYIEEYGQTNELFLESTSLGDSWYEKAFANSSN